MTNISPHNNGGANSDAKTKLVTNISWHRHIWRLMSPCAVLKSIIYLKILNAGGRIANSSEMALLEQFQGLSSISNERHGNHVHWSGIWLWLICFGDRWCFLTCSAGQKGSEMEKYSTNLASDPKLICDMLLYAGRLTPYAWDILLLLSCFCVFTISEQSIAIILGGLQTIASAVISAVKQ